MLDNIMSSLKAQGNRVSENFNLQSLKQQTSRISENLVASRERVTKLLSTRLNSESWGKARGSGAATKQRGRRVPDLKWPVMVHDDLKWVSYGTLEKSEPTEEVEESIIDKFIRVITPDDESRLNDREEIRRRLAMGSDTDDYYGSDRPGRKPSLQSRLQSGMNLQICFMNETASDSDSVGSDTEMQSSSLLVQDRTKKPEKEPSRNGLAANTKPLFMGLKPHAHSLQFNSSQSSSMILPSMKQQQKGEEEEEMDFFAKQAKLQAEARLALAQAKEMAHMQMEIERQQRKKSPITEMVRHSLEKAGIAFPPDRRRVSRQILTEMNVAQLQIIVNDLHTQIEVLNEELVKLLLERDDLHMEQDSMLVDIEDLTRYLTAKEQAAKDKKTSDPQQAGGSSSSSNNSSPTPVNRNQSRTSKIRSLVKK